MSTTDSNGIVFLEESDPISPFHTLMNTLQQGTSDAITDLVDWDKMPSESPALYGSYTGQRLRTESGPISVTTNSSSLATVTLPVSWSNGLKSCVFTSQGDTVTQLRLVSASGPNSVTLVARLNTGGGAGATTFGVTFMAQGW